MPLRVGAAAVLAMSPLIGCAGASRSTAATGPTPRALRQVSPADARFMAGMIPHHAQAVKIAGWAASHGARSDIRILAERIIVAQRDEIALMQTWLADRGLPVPAADATHHRMVMNGTEHAMLMPGMLTDEELARLDQARGWAFDRLFLTYMIRHHEGALTMANELFATDGAGQDEVVFRFGSDVVADQSTEIERMQSLLRTIPTDGAAR
ncbi:MAG: DUF305 domain-containing protein [Gemmatimonadales bacterium]